MKKVIKWLAIGSSIVFALILIILIASYLNHVTQLAKEDEQFIPNGELVKINDHHIHVFTEGTGDETLVFMAGGGTSSPMLDFKSLYSLLQDSYKIVVIEKAGYGFSDITDEARDIDTILFETREALKQSGVTGPYILLPHSMSGIEALYWAQVYPDEVQAIIGLDMAVPAAYENYDINMPLIHLGAFIANNGLTRWIPNISESEAIKYGTLTENEKTLYKTIFYRRTSTKNMIEEVKQIKTNAKTVAAKSSPNIPMLLFSSNGEGTGWDEPTWVGFQQDFIRDDDKRSIIQLNASHYLHNILYEQMADDIHHFIEDKLDDL